MVIKKYLFLSISHMGTISQKNQKSREKMICFSRILRVRTKLREHQNSWRLNYQLLPMRIKSSKSRICKILRRRKRQIMWKINIKQNWIWQELKNRSICTLFWMKSMKNISQNMLNWHREDCLSYLRRSFIWGYTWTYWERYISSRVSFSLIVSW